MPARESSSAGPCPLPNSTATSRKEKKKQEKEERDRLKQVEKKKRRLEKALATAAAIRIELEKKKQKRKEEEQRLDEEGAALAEAVALQVLVGEDVDGLEESIGTYNEVFEETDESCSLGSEDKVDEAGKSLSHADDMRIRGQSLELKQQICHVYTATAEGKADNVGNDLYRGWELSINRASGHVKRDEVGNADESKLEKVNISDWEIFDNPEHSLKASNELAEAAEVAAGMAAAQAVAALRIAEEARAEAEAAKKAAEAAISQVLDRKQTPNIDEVSLQVNIQPSNAEMERDELKARLEETERQLKEKTRQVVHLERNLEDVTEYLLQLKAKLPFVMVGPEREAETSERDSTNPTESSCGTVDQ